MKQKSFVCCELTDVVLQVYWFKDGKQISKRSEHYRISRDVDGTCSLHTVAASLDDDGNYTIMAGNPLVSSSPKRKLRKRVLNDTGSHQRPDEGQMSTCFRPFGSNTHMPFPPPGLAALESRCLCSCCQHLLKTFVLSSSSSSSPLPLAGQGELHRQDDGPSCKPAGPQPTLRTGTHAQVRNRQTHRTLCLTCAMHSSAPLLICLISNKKKE